MTSESWDLAAVQRQLREFAAARDWEQFHSPKNLAMALASEAGELLEIFQWLTEEQSGDVNAQDKERAAEELADVAIYLVRISDVLGVSLPDAVAEKLQLNEERYPVELAKGDATKHSRRGER